MTLPIVILTYNSACCALVSFPAARTLIALTQHTFANMSDEIKSKGGASIEVGDTVETPYRGGTHTFEE